MEQLVTLGMTPTTTNPYAVEVTHRGRGMSEWALSKIVTTVLVRDSVATAVFRVEYVEPVMVKGIRSKVDDGKVKSAWADIRTIMAKLAPNQ